MRYHRMTKNNTKAICTNCREHVDYNVIEVEDVWCIINQEFISYMRKDAICKKCGDWVYVEELEKYNVEEPIRIYNEWRG